MGILDNLWKAKPEDKGRSATAPGAERSYKIGDRIANRYEIHNIFGGEGKTGMGIVYVCHDHEFNELIALKTFQDRYLNSKKIKDSFKKEALAWIHLEKHPNIVRAHWVQELDNRIFVACEFITPDGRGRNTLTHHFKEHLSLKQILSWAIQFCHGMEYASSKGVTPHRDIKPDNIMITLDNNVQITDFGLVGLWDKAEMSEEFKDLIQKKQMGFTFLAAANNRIVAGTPPWMAPEQFSGISDVRSDIYSFGIVLFQLLNRGELPFRPKKDDKWETAHKTYPIPQLKAEGKLFIDIMERCLNKRREKRYGNFRELRSDLELIFRREITKKTSEKPPPPPELGEMKESELINKGLSLANLGLIDEAVKKYREGLKINPKNASAHNNLGNALAQKGSLDEAIREYKEALRCDRDYASAHYNLGIALAGKGLFDEAIKEYRSALNINPTLTEAYVNLGDAFSKKGLFDEAIKMYKETLRIKPESIEARINLGNAVARKGLLDEAINEYKKALSIKPGIAEAHHNLATAFFKKGMFDEAVNEYKEALKINPEYAEAHHNLATAFFKKGMFDEAVNEYKEALRIKPEYAEALYNLGFALVKKNLFKEAISAYENFIKYARKQDARLEKAKEIIGKLKGK